MSSFPIADYLFISDCNTAGLINAARAIHQAQENLR